MFYEPKDGHGLPHAPFLAIVAPRPIGWISTIGKNGNANLAPYSFFNGVSIQTPLVAFSGAGLKDSAANAIATGEFVVNLATRPLAEKMNLTSALVPQEIDEFDLAGIDKAPSKLVKPPRVKNSPAALECRVTQHINLKDTQGRDVSSTLVIGEVVGVYICDDYLTDGRFDVVKAQTIARLGYLDFSQITDLFEMKRPNAPQT